MHKNLKGHLVLDDGFCITPMFVKDVQLSRGLIRDHDTRLLITLHSGGDTMGECMDTPFHGTKREFFRLHGLKSINPDENNVGCVQMFMQIHQMLMCFVHT